MTIQQIIKEAVIEAYVKADSRVKSLYYGYYSFEDEVNARERAEEYYLQEKPAIIQKLTSTDLWE